MVVEARRVFNLTSVWIRIQKSEFRIQKRVDTPSPSPRLSALHMQGRGEDGGNVSGGVSIITVVRSIRFIIPLLALLAASAVSAQQARVAVRMVGNTKTLQAGQQGVAAVVMDVAAGFHAQSHRPLEATYIPTNVTLKPNT